MARIYIRAFAINLLCNNVSPYSGRQSGGADQQTRQGQVLVQPARTRAGPPSSSSWSGPPLATSSTAPCAPPSLARATPYTSSSRTTRPGWRRIRCGGADPNARDNWSYTPLHEASIKVRIVLIYLCLSVHIYILQWFNWNIHILYLWFIRKCLIQSMFFSLKLSILWRYD